MRYQVTLNGVSPLLCNNGDAAVNTRTPVAREIAAIAGKKGSNRTELDDERLRELECLRALYLDDAGRPTFPATAIRAVIERGARKLKQGPLVREGLVVENVDRFEYDVDRYGKSGEEVAKNAQFISGVVNKGGGRVARTRPRFDLPWAVVATVDVDDELVDQPKLESWLDIGGRRIGIGDWRPERSGVFGRFTPEVRPLNG